MSAGARLWCLTSLFLCPSPSLERRESSGSSGMAETQEIKQHFISSVVLTNPPAWRNELLARCDAKVVLLGAELRLSLTLGTLTLGTDLHEGPLSPQPVPPCNPPSSSKLSAMPGVATWWRQCTSPAGVMEQVPRVATRQQQCPC